MVHQIRNSVKYALGQMGMRALPWGAFFLLPPLIIFLVSFTPPYELSPPWWFYAAAGGIFLLCWGVHSRRAWMSLFDRSPKIELHATFLRARELDRDILWKDVWKIEWQATWGTRSAPESYLFLSLDGKKRRVPLDLIGLDMEGARLELLASDLRATDAERRLAGEALDAATEVAPAPEPVRTKGHSADELGEEVERFGPGAGGPVFFICFGAVGLLAGVAFSLYVYLVHPEGWPIALIPLGFGALWGLALIAPSVKWSRATLYCANMVCDMSVDRGAAVARCATPTSAARPSS